MCLLSKKVTHNKLRILINVAMPFACYKNTRIHIYVLYY